MLNQLRTYRTPIRFVAIVLLIASVLPFIGHACLMAETHDMSIMSQCCCEKEHSGHKGMEERAKCDHLDATHADGHGKNLPGDCCAAEFESFITNATSRTKATTLKNLSTAIVILPRSSFPSPPKLQWGIFRDLGPPLLASPPLHILNSQFLI